jgi:hypothetical protein
MQELFCLKGKRLMVVGGGLVLPRHPSPGIVQLITRPPLTPRVWPVM